MKKKRKIPVDNLGHVAYYLLQITQGIFKWNGELFFCPFVTLEDKAHPLRVSTWSSIAQKGKYALPFILNGTLCLFADPVDPITYTKLRRQSMDMFVGIDSASRVFKQDKGLTIINKNRTDNVEFVRTITDAERNRLFGSYDVIERRYRHAIWETSKTGADRYFKGVEKSTWLENYKEFRKNKESQVLV